jgi:hypothetical protein
MLRTRNEEGVTLKREDKKKKDRGVRGKIRRRSKQEGK